MSCSPVEDFPFPFFFLRVNSHVNVVLFPPFGKPCDEYLPLFPVTQFLVWF